MKRLHAIPNERGQEPVALELGNAISVGNEREQLPCRVILRGMERKFIPRSTLFRIALDQDDRTIAGIEEGGFTRRIVSEHHLTHIGKRIQRIPYLLALGAPIRQPLRSGRVSAVEHDAEPDRIFLLELRTLPIMERSIGIVGELVDIHRSTNIRLATSRP